MKALLVLILILGIGAGLVFWKSQIAVKDYSGESAGLTAEEVELILSDANPLNLKGLKENPKQKELLVKNLTEQLSYAAEAKRIGLAKDPMIKAELKHIDAEILAAYFDQKINEGKGAMPRFGFIGEDRVKAYWESGNWFEKFFDRKESAFKSYINTRLGLAKRSGRVAKDKQPDDAELEQARGMYAKVRISYDDAKAKLKAIKATGTDEEKKDWARFEKKVAVQSKMQKAGFLARTFVAEKLKKKLEVSDAEIDDYLKKNPELADTKKQREAATEVLGKVKNGGDFAELAKEYSEDPGSKNRGGLYEGITPGRFAPEFEAAVGKLKPGEVADELVETQYGFHIIKLVKRGVVKGKDGKATDTFDARHILIATTVSDPDNPQAQPMPAKIFVRRKLEKEKQEKEHKKILESNKVAVASDFKIPEPSPADLEKLMKQQQPTKAIEGKRATPGAKKDVPKPPETKQPEKAAEKAGAAQ